MKRYFICYLFLMAFTACQERPALTVYCTANLKKPVEEIAAQYGKERGIEVRLQYGPTGTLLSQLQVAKRGDLIIVADDGSLEDARKKNLLHSSLALTEQHCVIAVKRGNPKNIHSIKHLMRPDVKLALPNPESASIGKITRQLLGAQWQKLEEKAVVMKPSVTEVAADVQLGAVDAAFVWDSTVPQFEGLEAVEVPELSRHLDHASAAVLSCSTQSESALEFARYLAAPEQGGIVFKKLGFKLAGE